MALLVLVLVLVLVLSTGGAVRSAAASRPLVLSILPPNASSSGAWRPRRRLAGMDGALAGNTEPLGYFYTRLRVGTPGQDFTVIVDTGSALLAVPCEGCKSCGRHMNEPFVAERSSSFRKSDCKAQQCSACDHGECTYRERFVEGSSISGKLSIERLGLLPASAADKGGGGGGGGGAAEPSAIVNALFGCQTSESGYFKSQDADGILGLGRGTFPTILDVLSTEGPTISPPPAMGDDAAAAAAAVQHGPPLPDTISFCIGRSGGEVALGVPTPDLTMPPPSPADAPDVADEEAEKGSRRPRQAPQGEDAGGGGGGAATGLANPYAALTALRPHKRHYIVAIHSLMVS
eukprot:COSAG06_NODE_2126_length_7537_cov_9.348077_3_plen_347_part_00